MNKSSRAQTWEIIIPSNLFFSSLLIGNAMIRLWKPTNFWSRPANWTQPGPTNSHKYYDFSRILVEPIGLWPTTWAWTGPCMVGWLVGWLCVCLPGLSFPTSTLSSTLFGHDLTWASLLSGCRLALAVDINPKTRQKSRPLPTLWDGYPLPGWLTHSNHNKALTKAHLINVSHWLWPSFGVCGWLELIKCKVWRMSLIPILHLPERWPTSWSM